METVENYHRSNGLNAISRAEFSCLLRKIVDELEIKPGIRVPVCQDCEERYHPSKD